MMCDYAFDFFYSINIKFRYHKFSESSELSDEVVSCSQFSYGVCDVFDVAENWVGGTNWIIHIFVETSERPHLLRFIPPLIILYSNTYHM